MGVHCESCGQRIAPAARASSAGGPESFSFICDECVTEIVALEPVPEPDDFDSVAVGALFDGSDFDDDGGEW